MLRFPKKNVGLKFVPISFPISTNQPEIAGMKINAMWENQSFAVSQAHVKSINIFLHIEWNNSYQWKWK